MNINGHKKSQNCNRLVTLKLSIFNNDKNWSEEFNRFYYQSKIINKKQERSRNHWAMICNLKDIFDLDYLKVKLKHPNEINSLLSFLL